jgi:hypothetical protein
VARRAASILSAIGVLAVTLAWLNGVAWAQSTGRSLDIQPGARENGMGAAGVALSGDPCDAIWWNPAALGFAEWFSGQWTETELLPGFADLPYHHVAGAAPIPRFGGVGVGATFLSYGSGPDPPNDRSLSVSAGYRLLPDLAFGTTAKYLHIEMGQGPGATASTFGFDLGCLYRKSLPSAIVALGLNAQNLGGSIRLISEDRSDPLGRNLKAGGAVTVPIRVGHGGYEIGGTAVVDFNQSLVTNKFRTWHGGVELYGAYLKWVRLMVRGGYYHDELGDIKDATYGAGLRVMGVAFDVAWIPQTSGLDEVRKMTLGLHSDFLASWLGHE